MDGYSGGKAGLESTGTSGKRVAKEKRTLWSHQYCNTLASTRRHTGNLAAE